MVPSISKGIMKYIEGWFLMNNRMQVVWILFDLQVLEIIALKIKNSIFQLKILCSFENE